MSTGFSLWLPAVRSAVSPIRWAVALPFLIFSLPVTGAQAQIDSAIVTALRDARRIRVELTDRGRLQGVFYDLAPTHLGVRVIVRPTIHESYFADRLVTRDSLARIWVRDGSHWRTGALVGGAAFGVVGFILGMKFHPSCGGAACVGGATVWGGGLGAVSGGLLGTLFIRWRLVWRL
jgi:hypothetical protein